MTVITISQNLENILQKEGVSASEYVPAYGGESAGLDLYNTGGNIYIQPSSKSADSNRVLVPTGIRMNIDKGYVAIIKERGSVTKTPLKIRAGVIDSGYTGEVFVNCVNVGDQVYTIYKDCKLPFQILVVKCDNEFRTVSSEDFEEIVEHVKRKSKKIGSSD